MQLIRIEYHSTIKIKAPIKMQYLLTLLKQLSYFRYFNHFEFFFLRRMRLYINSFIFFKNQRALFSVDFMHNFNFSLKYH